MTARRRRRTAEDARTEILDAAERRIAQNGPAGIRLQEIAADVGVSHPAVLHHFGSREGLVRAVVERAMQNLEEDLVRLFAAASSSPPDSGALLDRVFETLFDRGQARLMAWLLLSGYEPLASPTTRKNWATIAAFTHALRTSAGKHGGKARQEPPALEDTVFTIVLAALALFGQAIAGRSTFEMAGLGADRTVDARFRRWLGDLLVRHLES